MVGSPSDQIAPVLAPVDGSGHCIIYLHGNRWDGVPARQRYLMHAMSRRMPVYYIEESEDRRWRVTWHRVSDGVTVIRGLMPAWIRFERRGWLWAQKLWSWFIRDIRRTHKHIVLWEAMNWLRCFRYVDHDTLVYDCIDPCFADDGAELAAFDDRERDYFTRADVVLASAESLRESAMRFRREAFLVNNACEPADYSPDLIAGDAEPEWWPRQQGPVAAYLGSLDARFDFQLMDAVVRRMPEVQFVFAGTQLREFEPQLASLRALANVALPGRVSLSEGRYLLAHCAVGLIPFVPGAMNDAINPVKMYAYAYLGKPMVGTAIRELETRPEIVATSNDPEGFVLQVRRAALVAADATTLRRLRRFGELNTWEHRATQVLDVLLSHIGQSDLRPDRAQTAVRGGASSRV